MRPARLTGAAILDAARAELSAGGLSTLSLRALATRLGVTAPALYAHFDSKEALLTAVANDEFQRLIESIENAAPASADPLTRIRQQGRAYVRHALTHPALFEVMFLSRPAWSSGADDADASLASKAFQVSATAVEDAIAAGLLRESDPLLASLTIWSAAHGVATVLLARPGLGDAYEAALVDSVIDSVVEGLRAPPPRSRKAR
jgi:AcrR family transcriptional regulator